MAAGTKKRKKRMKRQLQKRFKQTSGTVIVETKESRQLRAYQAQLDEVYGTGMITPVERFINQNAVLIHHCSDCKKDFYAKPRWLVKGQPHNCKSGGIAPNKSRGKSSKKDHKIKTDEKKGAELAKELDELIEQGLSPCQIRNKTGVDIQIVAYYKEKFHTKTRQQG
ncbi:hypothetical protein [Peribacillus simplex]|uniref:Uncharacterized protein n=1 Tax=Peribacillus simplex TaxID=1478 RepID=A0AAW7IKD7_9BACI|nr:hypothetical protein [Peribacillus simplex]MDM5450687.1 hypothetical protein [Peribacillus simplex]